MKGHNKPMQRMYEMDGKKEEEEKQSREDGGLALWMGRALLYEELTAACSNSSFSFKETERQTHREKEKTSAFLDTVAFFLPSLSRTHIYRSPLLSNGAQVN
jgi:hypothetical protein